MNWEVLLVSLGILGARILDVSLGTLRSVSVIHGRRSMAFFLGFAEVYLVYIVVKLAVITGAHSAVKWDAPLYRIKALKPLMWLVQRTVSTPSTHYAHHAMHDNDGIGHYSGNFGNLLFFWDVLFGTAHITQQYPAEVGLRDDQLFGREDWWVQLFYPLFRSRRRHSALVPGGKPYREPTSA